MLQSPDNSYYTMHIHTSSTTRYHARRLRHQGVAHHQVSARAALQAERLAAAQEAARAAADARLLPHHVVSVASQ